MELIQNNNRNLISKDGDQFYIHWEKQDRVEFREIKNVEPEKHGLIRVFSITGDHCQLQFRALQSLTRHSKEKNLIATAVVTIEDLEFIITEMKKRKI